ncbi:MAG: hypothetical protein ABIG63_16995 [Chloroflexota bacterium]
MHTNDPKDLLAGKGEEMIPDRGIPFDDIEDSAPHTDEWKPPDSPEMRENIPASTDKEYSSMEGNTHPPEDTPDDGMSAGYHPFKFETLPPELSTPIIELEHESLKGAPLFFGKGMEIPGPSGPIPDDGASVPPEEVIATDTMLKLLVTHKRVCELWKRADIASENIESEISNVQLARQLLDQIKFARHELLGGQDHYEEAERHINEAEFSINFAHRVRKWSCMYGIPLFIYEILFGAVLIGSLFFTSLGEVAFASGTDIARNAATILDPALVYLLACMIWGGFGSVIGALLSLVRHISEDQDFDKQFFMWYFGSPLVGMGVGIAVYLLMRTGLLSILGSDPDSNITSPIIIYVLAWLAGYQHNVFTEIVRRLMKVFRIESEEKDKKTAPPAPKSGPQGKKHGANEFDNNNVGGNMWRVKKSGEFPK